MSEPLSAENLDKARTIINERAKRMPMDPGTIRAVNEWRIARARDLILERHGLKNPPPWLIAATAGMRMRLGPWTLEHKQGKDNGR